MIRVGVLRGGTGPQYEASLATGAFVLKHLPREEFEPVDIFVDREGLWHLSGKLASHDALARSVDVVWNALHGHYGEDGKVQQVFRSLSLPYVGSDSLSSAVAMHERMLNEHLASKNLPIRKGVHIDDWAGMSTADAVSLVGAKLSPPWFVMPVRRGESTGDSIARTRHELVAVLGAMQEANVPVFVEEAVLGREARVITVPGFRGEQAYTFLPIMTDTGRATNARAPEHLALQDLAKKVHAALGLDHYSCTHIVVTPKGKMVVRRVDTVPDFGPESPVHAALATTGATFGEFARHLIQEALGNT